MLFLAFLWSQVVHSVLAKNHYSLHLFSGNLDFHGFFFFMRLSTSYVWISFSEADFETTIQLSPATNMPILIIRTRNPQQFTFYSQKKYSSFALGGLTSGHNFPQSSDILGLLSQFLRNFFPNWASRLHKLLEWNPLVWKEVGFSVNGLTLDVGRGKLFSLNGLKEVSF